MGPFEESFPPAAVRFADPDPTSNCFKTGTSADFPRVPEDARAVNGRTLDWYDALTPQNDYHCWMVDQVAVASVRIDHINRVERRARDRVVLRARLFWDDDRRLEAEVLGESLAKSPAQVVNQLRRTPQGCDWMIDRWATLARIADLGNGWDQAQTSRAWDLLGTRAEDRIGEIGEVIDQQGQVVSSSIGVADLARREIDALQGRKEEVAGLDVLDRAMAEADYMAIPTPEIHQLHRQGGEQHRRMKWFIGQLRAKPIYPATKSQAHNYYWPISYPVATPAPAEAPPAPSPPAEAPTAESPAAPVLRPVTDETDEYGRTWQYLINARRDARDQEDLAREEARFARRERRRA